MRRKGTTFFKTYTFGAKLSVDEDGYYIEFSDGQDAFQLFREAVYWWRHQLELLEEELRETQASAISPKVVNIKKTS